METLTNINDGLISSILNRIDNVENSLLGKITKNQLENNGHNFNKKQTINRSEIVTLNSLPSFNSVIEENEYGDFSNFCRKWNNKGSLSAIDIASSDNGVFQILSVVTGGIYFSIDSGNTWTPIDIFSNNSIRYDNLIYSNVAISSNGSCLIAVGSLGTIISKDFGYNWEVKEISSTSKYSACMSSDGEIQYISNYSGIFKSTDKGNSFNIITEDYNFITCSSNGQHGFLFNKDISSKILYSNDYGVTLSLSDLPINFWVSVKCSSSGQYLTAISNDSLIYISSNYGVNWILLDARLYETFSDLSISGSGKFQLISGTNINISKDYGLTWRNVTIDDTQIRCVNLSKDGKCATLSTTNVFTSLIVNEYIKECGMSKFNPLDQTLFTTNDTWLIPTSPIYSDVNLYTELSGNLCKVSSSRFGKYQTICVNNGNIWKSDNYSNTFKIANLIPDFSNTSIEPYFWISVDVSDSGKFQTAITVDSTIWRSDDYGINFFQVIPSYIPNNTFNDIKISANGRYQTICGNLGQIVYSTDYGYNWTTITFGSDNLLSITMSKSGRYQSVCGTSDYSNSILMSKTFGVTWKYSNFQNNSKQWNSISCSSCGQYQTLCGNSEFIFTSDNYGFDWTRTLSGSGNWNLVYITDKEQYQLACNYDGDIFLSTDFGQNWNSCYTATNTIKNWKSITVSDTLQYITVLYESGMLISKIDNNGFIPGFIKINTNSVINNNGIILLTGSNPNIYSYETNFNDSFNIISSNLEDDGEVSYSIESYGQILD